MKKRYLLAPGPTPVPEHVSLEMAQPMLHHRTPQFSEILLNELDPEETRSVIGSKAEQLFGSSETPHELVELIINRSQGNPFYAEELLVSIERNSRANSLSINGANLFASSRPVSKAR